MNTKVYTRRDVDMQVLDPRYFEYYVKDGKTKRRERRKLQRKSKS